MSDKVSNTQKIQQKRGFLWRTVFRCRFHLLQIFMQMPDIFQNSTETLKRSALRIAKLPTNQSIIKANIFSAQKMIRRFEVMECHPR